MNRLHKAATVRGVLKGMMMNAGAAFILFLVCKNILLTSDLVAVLISGVPAVISTLVSALRQRRRRIMQRLGEIKKEEDVAAIQSS